MSEQNEIMKLDGSYILEKKSIDGSVERREIKNLITTIGKAEVAGLITDSISAVKFRYIALGIGVTPAAVTDTILESEIVTGGGERAAATCSRVTTTTTNDTGQFVKVFTFSAPFAITEIGLFNDPTAGVLLSHQVFGAINVISTDTLSITYKIKVS